jgi:hypothetical protein
MLHIVNSKNTRLLNLVVLNSFVHAAFLSVAKHKGHSLACLVEEPLLKRNLLRDFAVPDEIYSKKRIVFSSLSASSLILGKNVIQVYRQ